MRPIQRGDGEALEQLALNQTDIGSALDHTEHDQELGFRLRALRKQRQLSIEALALKSGLSTGMLSLIERGRATPSIRSLRSLGQALNVEIAWFFTRADAPTESESPYIVRANARGSLRLTSTNVRKELLTTPGGIEIYEIALDEGGTSGPEFAGQIGEKAGIVLSGTFRLWLDERSYLLRDNDSFNFPASIAHRFDNPGPGSVRIYWIVAKVVQQEQT